MWSAAYRQFVERRNLIGVEIEIPETDDLSGMGASIQLYSEAEAIAEAEFYPGVVVRADGFAPIGECLLGGGDPYFINIHEEPPSPVYRIYHDSVADSSYDREQAIEKVLESYEALLDYRNV